MEFDKKKWHKAAPFVAGIFSAIVINLFVNILYYNELPCILFHLLYWVLIGSSALVIVELLRGKYANTKAVFLFLLFVLFSLRLISQVRTPASILRGPDLNYEWQLIERMIVKDSIEFSYGTGQATGYNLYPGLELLIVSLHSLTAIGPLTLLAYTGAFLGTASLLFFERFYYHFLRSERLSIASAVITGLCPFLVGMGGYTIHHNLALLYFAVFLWSLTKSGRIWFLVSLAAIAGVFITHHLSLFILVVFFILMIFSVAALRGLFRIPVHRLIKRRQIRFFSTILVIIAIYLGFFAPLFITQIVKRLKTDILENIWSPDSYTATYIAPVEKSIWLVAFEVIGYTVFALFAIKYIESLKRKDKRLYAFLPYTSVGSLIFLGFMLVWVSGLTYAQEVVWRGLIYLYVFASPLFVLFLYELKLPKTGRLLANKKGVMALIVLLFFVGANSVYHGVPAQIYDNGSDYTYSDARLPLEQWQETADFVKLHAEIHYSYGMRLTYEYVGGRGHKVILPYTGDSNLTQWSYNNPDEFLFLRRSITETPDYNGLSLTTMEMEDYLANSTVIYSTGETLLLRTIDTRSFYYL